jgi:hypothetical protein
MRCGCPHCETFMVQAEAGASVCVCPASGYRCNACLGMSTALTREELGRLRQTDWFAPSFEGAPEENDPDTETAYVTPIRPDDPEEF